MKTIIAVIAALLMGSNSYCSQPDSVVRKKIYHVNYYVTGSIIAVGAVSDIFAISRLKGKQTITDEELLFANTESQKNLINPIDRWALTLNPANRPLWEDISNYGQTAIFLLPALLMIDKNIRKDWYNILLMYIEGHTITFTFYNYSFLGPTFQNRFRPVVYYPEFANDVREKGGNRNSFYSGHVASCTYSMFFMAKVFCDYHPELGGKKYLIYLAASVPAVFMGYARIAALDHFPSDVGVGFLLGAVIGIVVPELHKIRKARNLSIGMFNSYDAMGMTVGWKFNNRPH
jgi:membrane-associated phospholipid phosphatase